METGNRSGYKVASSAVVHPSVSFQYPAASSDRAASVFEYSTKAMVNPYTVVALIRL
jgi:hypothetical protein